MREPPEPPKKPGHTIRRRQSESDGEFEARVRSLKEQWRHYEEELSRYKEEFRKWKRAEENETYTADPVAYIDLLARDYNKLNWRSYDFELHQQDSNRLYRNAQRNFIEGCYLTALSRCYKSDKVDGGKRAAQLVADVQRAILKKFPPSAFRDYLQEKAKSWAGVGLRGKRF